jgi:hypothetical protein
MLSFKASSKPTKESRWSVTIKPHLTLNSYKELSKHATISTVAQPSFDTLLKRINRAQYTGNWHGTSYAFVLHWREQISQNEKLEREHFPISNIAE